MFELPDLKFGKSDLEPYISERTLEFHHGAHHKAYIEKTNSLIYKTSLQNQSLLEIMRKTRAEPDFKGLFNSAAQSWNHSFYWNSLTPGGGGNPTPPVAELVEQSFGSYEALKTEFIEKGGSHFGSGWIWLAVVKDSHLELICTENAETPALDGTTPILVCDLWEHAYYLDYQSKRADYIEKFLDHCCNWAFAEKCLMRRE